MNAGKEPPLDEVIEWIKWKRRQDFTLSLNRAYELWTEEKKRRSKKL